MTRQELYNLVWQMPMMKLAKTFGLSDVGLRKICVKYNIPTPPIGYWAKRAHGKHVRQPALPALGPNGSDVIQLVVHDTEATPAEVLQAQEAALAREGQFSPISVAGAPPKKLHTVALATAQALRSAKVDNEGMKKAVDPRGVAVSVGRGSMDRALCIVEAVARAAELRGYSFLEHEQGIRIVVDGIPIAWRLNESKDPAPHIPTKQELEAQAKREEDRKRWPTIYSARSKAYRSWDYSPSGRLSMTFTDATRRYWGRTEEGLVGYWRDRKSASLEAYLDDAMRALVLAVVTIKWRLAEEAEKERLREDARERWRQEEARKARAAKRHEFLFAKANEFDRYQKLAAFTEYLEREVRTYGSPEPVDRLINEMRMISDVMGEGFGRLGLSREIAGLALYVEDDLQPFQAAN